MCPATELQALGLRLQMRRLSQIIAARRAAAEYLTSRFEGVPGLVPQLLDTEETRSTHHLYLLQVEPAELGGGIEDLKAELATRGVTNIPHFAPLYKLRALRDLGYDTRAMQASCPVAEEAFTRRFTHLPLYALTRGQLEYLANAVIEAAEAVRDRPRRRGKRKQ
jgi:dTDP-4-amino-4,6-dideoxygalactose transaminase